MTKKQVTAAIAIGSMSSEVIEATFRYSHYHRKQLMLISSKNQIDYSGGYVNKWTTAQYMKFVREMKGIYSQSDILICRDHCGPGFNGNNDLKNVYATIEDDIKNGFDLMHIDFCHFKGSKEEMLTESKKAIELCRKLNPNILLEIGTDENLGTNYSISNINHIAEEIDYFKSFCDPEFYVVQTGTLVAETRQAGVFNSKFTKDIGMLLKDKGLKLKEHNADYLTKEQVIEQRALVDCMNNAPQFGVVQTSTVLAKCLVYGISTEKFIDEVYNGQKWKKWMDKNGPENKGQCSLIAGHYHFAGEAYKDIIQQLKTREDIKETLINIAMDVIDHYIS